MARMNPAPLLAAVVFGLGGSHALGQGGPALKPGLWEHSIQMSDDSGEMQAAMKEAQAAMADMPPEQRKMMEQMMAKQGVSFDASGQKVRICMTPEDVALDKPPPAQDGCTQTATRSGNTWNISYQCPARNGQPASNGRGTVTIQGSTAYSGQFTMNTQAGKKTETMKMSTQGRWVAASCGNVQPARR